MTYDPPTGDYPVNFKKMKINFVSDNWDQKDGFKLNYMAISSVDDYSGLEDLTVYPNPVCNSLHVDFNLMEDAQVSCCLVDLTGKIVKTENVQAVAGENKMMLDVTNLSKGLYMLQVNTPTGKAIQKVVVQ